MKHYSPTFVGFFVSSLIISNHLYPKSGHKYGGHTPMGVWNQIDKWTTLSRTERIKTKSINSTKFLNPYPKRRGVGCVCKRHAHCTTIFSMCFQSLQVIYTSSNIYQMRSLKWNYQLLFQFVQSYLYYLKHSYGLHGFTFRPR